MSALAILSDLDAEQINGGGFIVFKDNTVNAQFASVVQGSAVLGRVKKADVEVTQVNKAFIVQKISNG